MNDQSLEQEEKAIVILKPDSIAEGCVPSILQHLVEEGFIISSFSNFELSSSDALWLYGYSEDETNEFRLAGVANITGECILLYLCRKDDLDVWTYLREIKGQPESTQRTLRGKVARFDLMSNPFARVKNRVHIPMNDEEVQKLIDIINKSKNLNFNEL